MLCAIPQMIEPSRKIAIAETNSGRRRGGRGQQICRDRPGHVFDAVQLAGHRRQCGRDDGLIDRAQKHAAHRAAQHQQDLAMREADRRGRVDRVGHCRRV
jgi:hypothetical protein